MTPAIATISLLSVGPSSATPEGLTPRAPIYIEGNAGFTPENGVNGGGSGTAGDPYIIENWDIRAENAHGIEIRNTTAHFVIRNCYVHDGWANHYSGIHFNNVVNGKIDNNIVENNRYYGIHLDYSDSNLVLNNVVENNLEGIFLGNSDNNLIPNNVLEINQLAFSRGISLIFSDNNLISNNILRNAKYCGIELMLSRNNLISNNIIENNKYRGIYLASSENNILRNNVLQNYGLEVFGNVASDFYHDIDTSNTINGKPIYYLIEQENLTVDGSAMDIGYLGLVSCENILVKNLAVSYNMQGILLANTSYSKIINSVFENNKTGMFFQLSSYNLIESCTIKNNDFRGVELFDYSDNNLISNNIVENNLRSIQFQRSNKNLISNNTCMNNQYGINLFNFSDGNLVYHNNFINDENPAYDDGSNYWDDGYPSGGNYWSDYTGSDNYRGENQDVAGSDGIGDTPYVISPGYNRDRYPLVNSFPLPWTGWSNIWRLETFYGVYLEKNLDLNQGSKLVVKFYTYWDDFEGENVIENFSPPWHVEENESARHSEGFGVEKASLVLTTNNTENVLSTITSWTTRKSHLIGEISRKKGRWDFADENERREIIQQLSGIKGQWPFAPF